MTTTAPAPDRARAAATDERVAGLVARAEGRDAHLVIRADGFLPGPGDIPLHPDQAHRHGLRPGDHVDGTVTRRGSGRSAPRRLARLDLVNGQPPERLAERPEFASLTPVHPHRRLTLETTRGQLATRVIDLLTPVGKGQRGLIVAPPKTGKTMILKAVAGALAHNHPECHVMAVLLDERPEEVTDMRRSVPAEVIASPFDRPPRDHTAVAALAVERAKRLVERGEDVVILLDSLTRLCRAHNMAARSTGRVLSGGVDASALHPPKRLFGAARAIEGGGSLTILATALVDTGSRADDFFFEELKSTGNMELRLDRVLAGRRVFPAVDIDPSGTRREEILIPPAERAAVHGLRRALGDRDPRQAVEILLDRLRETGSNAEFLRRVSLTTLPV
ncbi:transcription termination factor Rho [Streptomyces sp. PT12]|uniref:transcription termination factor Rho n=1 Tax=Streptomyces sp. PT12 TaxID=1510197 RepID=UPI000DE31D15|nr:transcription termination factor Rho [Streptomyces sp. PT12]RBM07272.1 transcription termination factor Rho [Streptomyces sp. PT12]